MDIVAKSTNNSVHNKCISHCFRKSFQTERRVAAWHSYYTINYFGFHSLSLLLSLFMKTIILYSHSESTHTHTLSFINSAKEVKSKIFFCTSSLISGRSIPFNKPFLPFSIDLHAGWIYNIMGLIYSLNN